jgi:acetoin utilization deacetylase AcuC-like enzyme
MRAAVRARWCASSSAPVAERRSARCGPVLEFRPQLTLISAGFDAHRSDPLADCIVEAGSYAQMTAQVLELASCVGAPVGVVLEGGDDPSALADSVLSTIGALNGQTKSESIAPDPMLTSRVAAHVGHFWTM